MPSKRSAIRSASPSRRNSSRRRGSPVGQPSITAVAAFEHHAPPSSTRPGLEGLRVIVQQPQQVRTDEAVDLLAIDLRSVVCVRWSESDCAPRTRPCRRSSRHRTTTGRPAKHRPRTTGCRCDHDRRGRRARPVRNRRTRAPPGTQHVHAAARERLHARRGRRSAVRGARAATPKSHSTSSQPPRGSASSCRSRRNTAVQAIR